MTPRANEAPGDRARGHGTAARAPARDLDGPQAISELVDAFYRKVLADPTLAPVFIDVARVDLDEHLPIIKAFWRRMLLGHHSYARNMVARHAAVHARFGLGQRHFDRWLALFTETVDERFAGPRAERARRLACTIAANLRDHLHAPEHGAHAPVESKRAAASGERHQ